MSDRGLVKEVTDIQYHRNGVGGEGFYCVRFTCAMQGPMLAIVFPKYDEEGGIITNCSSGPGWFNPRVAVLKESLLPDVTFGVNSWRGDGYADALFRAVAAGTNSDIPKQNDGESHEEWVHRWKSMGLAAANEAVRNA